MSFQFSPEQQEAYNNCTKLQQNTVINMIAGGMSQVKAYKKAGGKSKTVKTCSAVVSRMLTDANVKAFYDSLKAEVISGAIMTRIESLEILSDIARTKITDVINFKTFTAVDDNGEEVERSTWALKEQDDMSEASQRSIQEVTAGHGGIKIKMHNQTHAIKQLALLEGWESATKHELSGPDGEEIKVTSDTDLARKIAFLLTKADHDNKAKTNT